MPKISRREFLKLSGATALGLAFRALDLHLLDPVDVPNPLAFYPERDWEQIYRDQYRYDSSFTYVCSPNDTHACRLRAFVRNGVILRSETNYDVARYSDLYGNSATPHWHPRGCKKGQTFHRRTLLRRAGRDLAARRWLPRGDDPGHGRRRHAHVQMPRWHGAAGRDRQVRHVPFRQHARLAP